MNPTRINTGATTPTTTTGSKLINEFRYLPLMATTSDGVGPMPATGGAYNLPAGATTAIATSSGSLVHVIPVQLAAPATSSVISAASVNLTTFGMNSNPMAPHSSISTTPTAVDGIAGMQAQTHAIPMDIVEESNNHQAAAIALPLSIPTSESINMNVSESAAATGLVRNVGILPTSSSSIISQGTPTNIGNVSTTVTSSSSSQAAATAPATFIIPTSTTSMATSHCQISNALPSHNLNHEMTKKIVIGANTTTHGANTTTTSVLKTQLPKQQHQLQSQILQQQQLQQQFTAPTLKNQELLNTTHMNTETEPSVSTPQQQTSAPPPLKLQFTASTTQHQKLTPPSKLSLATTQQLEPNVAQAANQIGLTPGTNNKKQPISHKKYPNESMPSNSNSSQLKTNVLVNSIPSACNDKTSVVTTNVGLEPKSSLLIKNNKKDSSNTVEEPITEISSTLTNPLSVVKKPPESANDTLEKNITLKLQAAKTLKTEEKKLPATEQKQESLLKNMQRNITEYTSPRSKRSKSLNSATVCDLGAQTTTIAAAERRFSSPDTQHKTKVVNPHSSSTSWSSQKKNDTTFVLIDDDDDDRNINQELAGFDEEYLDDTSTSEKSSDASECKIETVKKESYKNDSLKINENSDKNENMAESPGTKKQRVAIIDFEKNTVKLKEAKPKICIDSLDIPILNEPLVKCKEIVKKSKIAISKDSTNENQELQHSEPLDKSLFCDEQLLVTSSSTSASSTSSTFLKNISMNESIKMKSSTATKSPITKSSATSSSSSSSSITSSSSSATSSSLPSVPATAPPTKSACASFDTKSIDTNSYSTVLGMLSTFNMISWKERIGTARGTNLRFQLNEFNLLQIYERCQPRYRIHTAYEKPIYERESYSKGNADPLLYLCRRCNCHGPACDFLAPEFCSLECLKRDTRKRRDFVGTTRKRPRKDTIATTVSTATSSAAQPAAPSSYSNNSSSLLVRRSIFRWSTYLTGKFGEDAAPVNLFLNPLPTGSNNFHVGMKLEAIDPENCSLFCVCTVLVIRGYRLNLGFDGFDRMYNFWVNADSMDIFPPGWCAKTNRILQPPKGLDAAIFNWPSYFVKEQAIPAPRQLFTHLNSSSLPTRNPFKVGMHLEAEDLNDTGKLCVATVADVLDERIRIHFDGWDDCYDYWVDTNSPYIHPCGWHEGRHQLVVPPDFDNSAFSWPDYIKEHSSNLIAPPEIFAARDPIDFKPKMKLEVVDPRNPMLIRPATVVARKGHRVKIHLDQWPIDYCFWLEDDSPDLHPIGWCDATKHDLEPPPGYQSRAVIMPCSIIGCRGIGNAKLCGLNMHSTRDACPYAPENWNIKIEKPLRVDGNEIERTITAKATLEQIMLSKRESHARNEALKAKQKQILLPVPMTSSSKSTVADDIIERLRLLDNIKTRRSLQEKLQQSKTSSQTVPLAIEGTSLEKLLEIKQELKGTMEVDGEKQRVEASESTKINKVTALHAPVDANAIKIAKEYLCDYGPRLQQNYNIWQQNLNFNCNDIKKNPLQWTTAECCLFVEKLLNLKTARAFANEDIDGAALLALQQSDLTDILDLKLGPAVKLYAHILQLRTFHVKMEKSTLKKL